VDAELPADLHFLTITEAASLIERRQLSPVELTRAFIDRGQALDKLLHVYIRPTAELALAQAAKAEQEIMGGHRRGPLHGVPFGAKDVFATQGLPTTGHSRAYAELVPTADATVISRLYDAGAVLLGKLSTHECAHGGPSFDLPWPAARNPWDVTRFTGGSSSGSGAGVAAGLMPAALGTDTGGSIRNPAALCGLVGLKPTYGLVSRFGVMPNAFSYDNAGPMTWTVADCALLLQAMAGHDPNDPASANRTVPDYAAALTGDIRGLRIGVLRHLYEEDVPVAAPVKAGMEAAIEVLRQLGAVIEDVRIRPAQEYTDVKIVGAESELFSVHEPILCRTPEKFGEDFLGRSVPAILIGSADVMRSQRLRRRMISEMEPLYRRYDILLTAGPGPAPPLASWRTIQFWQKASLTTPFNVSGAPALVQCMGYTEDGLPLSMQVTGRPFDEVTVLRVADAYERATSWRHRRPVIDLTRGPLAQPPLPSPEPATLSHERRAEIAARCRDAGLTRLSDRVFEQLCASVPPLEAMLARLRRMENAFDDEPANIFAFPISLTPDGAQRQAWR
jgi:aspartyl-tRNA(Asn)/glutamyl-tRNA(Gln) amidotransferase subunit A